VSSKQLQTMQEKLCGNSITDLRKVRRDACAGFQARSGEDEDDVGECSDRPGTSYVYR
jgi:hypothetical protein